MPIDRNSILNRYGIVIIFIVCILGLIVYKIINIMFVEGQKWRNLGEKNKIENIQIEPTRGNIYAADGRLMASSIPQYELYLDFKADGYMGTNKRISSQDSLDKYMSGLCKTLSEIIGDKSPEEYRRHIRKGLSKESRQFKISAKKVSYTNLKLIKENPFMKLAPGISGFYTKTFFQRRKPFGSLASRTIGDIYSEKNKGGKNGLELQFDSVLHGIPGLCTRQKVRTSFINITQREPVDGMDIMTTIDVNIQDIAEKALIDKLTELEAESGTVVLMETNTGEVKAITNMARMENGEYGETRNQAVSDLSEPGSTFKVASMMVALDDGKVNPSDTIDTGNGLWTYKGKVVRDHNWDKGGYHRISAAQTIWYSSNVGVSKIIDKAYHDCPARYVDKINQLGFNRKLDFQIPGQAAPRIKYPGNSNWYKTTLAWMSFGYETQIPPIYTLTFFNAIANNGKMIKPFFVRSINHNGTVMRTYEQQVVNPQVCTPKTLAIIKDMLLGVVEKGTGKSVESPYIRIAGKTGTAQVSQGSSGYSGHQVSFCGYFPADKPKYTGIVVIRYPKIGHPSGGTMSGAVFKRIAEQVYARSLTVPAYLAVRDSVNTPFPMVKAGLKSDIQSVLRALRIHTVDVGGNNNWAKPESGKAGVALNGYAVAGNLIPDVKGMGARDAVFLLENSGLRVKLMGCGTVVSQTPAAGTLLQRGQVITITLQ
jgi:Cell division protein FtsI/penicillin-binding protein 2